MLRGLGSVDPIREFVQSFLSMQAPKRFEVISKQQHVDHLITPEEFVCRAVIALTSSR